MPEAETRSVELTAAEAHIILSVLSETVADYPNHFRKFAARHKNDPQMVEDGHKQMLKTLWMMDDLNRRLSAVIDELEPDEVL